MSTFSTRRPNLFHFRVLGLFTLALTIHSLAAADASAQGVRGGNGGIHGYFARFYGVDYYDGQRTGLLAHRGRETQYHGGFYGPPMMYDRQYGDTYGYRTDPGYASPRLKIGTGYGYDTFDSVPIYGR